MAINGVLVCNMGSSSLKVTRYQQQGHVWHSTFHHKQDGEPSQLVAWLMRQLDDTLLQDNTVSVRVVLHRIVHAGLVDERPMRYDRACHQQIAHWSAQAPLHNPPALQLMQSVQRQHTQLVQYAVFDSGLYRQLPEVARRYAIPNLPEAEADWPLQRYGFHGLAHRSLWRQLPEVYQQGRLITVQLGSGCSLTAWHHGQAIDNSMGFTPLEGVMMASRCGDIDAGVLLHWQQHGYDATRIRHLLSEQSGLRGVSGISGDMRVLLASNHPQAQQAIALYVYKIKKQLGAYLAILGGVDALCFGGGVGENQPYIRQQILHGLQELGIVIDEQANLTVQGCAGEIHAAQSNVWVAVRLVDESVEMLNQWLKGNEKTVIDTRGE